MFFDDGSFEKLWMESRNVGKLQSNSSTIIISISRKAPFWLVWRLWLPPLSSDKNSFSRLSREGITQIVITCHTIKNNDTNRMSLMNDNVNYWKIHPQASIALKWIGFLFGYCIDCIFWNSNWKRPLWTANLISTISDFNTRTGLNSYILFKVQLSTSVIHLKFPTRRGIYLLAAYIWEEASLHW